jgi:hypothetical protein
MKQAEDSFPESYYKTVLCNFSLEDLPEEGWKDIPGYGAYQLSSHGRLKSLARRVQMPQNRFRLQKERIKKVFLTRHTNKHLQTRPAHIFCCLSKDGIKRNVSLARLVYCLFVEPFDLEDTSKVVSYKDSNGENVHYTNLELLTISEQKYKMFKRGRAKSHRSDQKIPVVQYDIEGNRVAEYESLYAAEKATGLNSGSIHSALVGKSFTAGGYRWLALTDHNKENWNEKPAPKSKAATPATPLINVSQWLNQRLWHALGCPTLPESSPETTPTGTIPTGIPPCLNLSDQELPGEVFRPIIGYETAYEISNLGRVRKKAGWSSASARKVWLTSQIIQLSLKKGSLSVGLTLNRKKHFFSIPRLLYAHFVEFFDLKDRHILIISRKSPLELSVDGLQKLSAREHKKLIHMR